MRRAAPQLQKPGRLALCLVVALLLVSALQVVEASHLHLSGDTSSECLLCKNSAVGIVEPGLSEAMPLDLAIPLMAQQRCLCSIHLDVLPPPRGPPTHA